ncbi:D-alanyl-D-alanine carboxypeptidase/D-alanyl-D-alanine endopeptidase [Mycobacterium haemophilum]
MTSVGLSWFTGPRRLIGLICKGLMTGLIAATAVAILAGHRATGEVDSPPPKQGRSQPALIRLDETLTAPDSGRLAATLAPLLANPELGTLTGQVADAMTGQLLWTQGERVPMQPASTTKVLTAAAALLTLDRDARLTTRVVTPARSGKPGQIVLVGGGDPALSAAPSDQDSWIRDAARIGDLAEQVRRSGFTPTSIQVDTSQFSGAEMAPGWDPADIDGGDIAPIESVMLDGGRTQPATADSPRSHTPALDAGRALADALGLDPADVVLTATPTVGRDIASVQSPPLMERLRTMMNTSDDVLAEAIGREVAAATHHPQSFAGTVQAVLETVLNFGIDLNDASLHDASGLSTEDRLTADTLDQVLNTAASSKHQQLRPLLDLLPVAGRSGTLAHRFLDHDTQAAAGWLRAKTGTLTGTNALAGIVTNVDGRVLTFALIANGAGPHGRAALDTVAAALRSYDCETPTSADGLPVGEPPP